MPRFTRKALTLPQIPHAPLTHVSPTPRRRYIVLQADAAFDPPLEETRTVYGTVFRQCRAAEAVGAKTLDKGQAQLCVLSADCSEPEYTKLVEALCAEHGVNLMKVSDKKQLGEWVGLAKLDQEGAARKVRPLKPCTQPSLGLSEGAPESAV